MKILIASFFLLLIKFGIRTVVIPAPIKLLVHMFRGVLVRGLSSGSEEFVLITCNVMFITLITQYIKFPILLAKLKASISTLAPKFEAITDVFNNIITCVNDICLYNEINP